MKVTKQKQKRMNRVIMYILIIGLMNSLSIFSQDNSSISFLTIENEIVYCGEVKQEQLKLVFALYYACGLRRTEGYNLTIKDIDFDNKTIFVKQGKNYKDRFIPINDSIKTALEHYIYNFRILHKTAHKRLFLETTGTLNNNLQHLQKITQNNELQSKKVTLHILRHSIATHLLENGMSVENISRFLGHSSLDSTQIYTHIINR